MFKKYKSKIYAVILPLLIVVIFYNIFIKRENKDDICYITDKIRYDLINMKVNITISRLNKAGAMEGELNIEKIKSNCINIVNTISEDTLLNKYNKFLQTIN